MLSISFSKGMLQIHHLRKVVYLFLESGGKVNTEDVRWNLKAVTFTRDSKQLVIHSRRGSTSKVTFLQN